MYGHRNPGHHVHDSPVGLEPANSPLEVPRQGMAIKLWVGSDEGAQKPALHCSEVAPALPALYVDRHPGAIRARLGPSLIDHGNWSPSSWPPFFRQARLHAPSGRQTLMPFVASLPTTGYTVRRARRAWQHRHNRKRVRPCRPHYSNPTTERLFATPRYLCVYPKNTTPGFPALQCPHLRDDAPKNTANRGNTSRGSK